MNIYDSNYLVILFPNSINQSHTDSTKFKDLSKEYVIIKPIKKNTEHIPIEKQIDFEEDLIAKPGQIILRSKKINIRKGTAKFLQREQ